MYYDGDHYLITTDGEDFLGSATNVTFSPGDVQKHISIQIVNDAVFEDLEDFFGTLTPVDTRVTIFEPDADVHINDDDGKVFKNYVNIFMTQFY